MLKKHNYKDLDKWRKSKNRQRKRYYDKTSNAANKGERWTQQEIDLVLKHEITDMELSRLIGRTVASIQSLRCKLKRQQNNNCN